jgi:diguanylate cyclase (GGDEF)-like protein
VVLYLDLDDFKAVNDTYGHATGDQLLHITGARILGCVHPSDLVARLGGDEFVVVLTGDPQIVGDRVRGAIETALREPVALGPVVASGSASIGVASVGPGERADATTVIARADALMYRAKQTGQTRMSTAPPAAVPPSAPPPTDPAPARR